MTDTPIYTAMLRFILIAATLFLAAPAFAQFDFDDDPLAPDASEAADAPAADVPPPTAVAAPDASTLAEFARRDAVVAAALDLPRDTPAQKLRTVLALADLGRTDVAATILPELLAAPLDDAQRAALVSQFGSATFLKLIRLDPPAPAEAEGGAAPASDLAGMREFAQQCLDAAAAMASDPIRLAGLIEGLSAPDESTRYAARVDLRATGHAGVVAAVNALAGATTATQRTHILEALAELRPTVDEPLVAVLADGRGQVRADAATLAGRLKMHAALPWLAALSASHADPVVAQAAQAALMQWGWSAPTPSDAQTLIRERMTELDAAPQIDDGGLRDTWWTWDSAMKTLSATEFSPEQRRVLQRARLTRALAEAGGTYGGDLRQALIDSLEAAALVGSELSPADRQVVTALSPAELSAALAEAMHRDRASAAAWLAAEIAHRGDVGVLSTGDGRPSSLAEALKSPVRSLRFAALEAVMALNPHQTFPGASYVPKALWYFVTGAGQPAAVVAAPVFAKASDYAGQLRGLGYESMPAGSGRTALMAALDPAMAPRLAVVMIDSDISGPTMREVIFQLRSSDRTALVPIVIAASVERLADAQRIAEVDPLTIATPRPHGEAALSETIAQARALAEHPMADEAIRIQQAVKALDWIAELLAEGAPYDELRRDAPLVQRALFVPELTRSAVRVLAALGTAESQVALADYASTTTLPIEIRRQAAEGLAASFDRYGIRLTSAQMLRQYDRYNASETADADTQQVLGNILDSLEKK